MKTLLVLRHAKSAWDDPALDDHDRPLNARGLRDAPRMGRLLREHELVPDGCLSSTATRALHTARRVAESCGYRGEIRATDRLYLADPTAWVEEIAVAGPAGDRLLIVGHNPGLEGLVELLTGASERLPTAALAQIDLPLSRWCELHLATRGVLAGVWRPKELAQEA